MHFWRWLTQRQNALELQQAEEAAARFLTDLVELQKRMDHSGVALNKQTARVIAVLAESESLTAERDHYKSALSTQAADLLRVQEDNCYRRKEYDKIAEVIGHMRAERERMCKASNELRGDLDVRSREVNGATIEVNRVSRKWNEAEDRVTELQADLATAEQLRAEQSVRLHDAEVALAAAEAKIEALETRNCRLAGMVKSIRSATEGA